MKEIKSSKRASTWIIKNNGDIVYPYSEAEKKGIGRREFRNSIDELMEKGFLDITHQGSGGRAGDMTRYLIDDRWKDYGKPHFRSPKKPRKKDDRKGRGWAAVHAKKKKASITELSPKKGVSSNKNDTRNKNNKKVSSDKSDTPKSNEPVQLPLIFEKMSNGQSNALE